MYLRALAHYHASTAGDLREAKRLLGRAIELDPGFALSYALLALVLTAGAHEGWEATTAVAFREALEASGIAIRLGDPDGMAHATRAMVYGLSGHYEQGIEAGREAVA